MRQFNIIGTYISILTLLSNKFIAFLCKFAKSEFRPDRINAFLPLRLKSHQKLARSSNNLLYTSNINNRQECRAARRTPGQASHQEKETLNDTRGSRQKENYKVVGGLGIRGILILVPQ